MIESSLNFVFLSEMVGCTIIICFLEYGVLKVFRYIFWIEAIERMIYS